LRLSTFNKVYDDDDDDDQLSILCTSVTAVISVNKSSSLTYTLIII